MPLRCSITTSQSTLVRLRRQAQIWYFGAGRIEYQDDVEKREEGFEAKFIHDEELRVRALARRNKLLGNWAAGHLGLTGDAAITYANELVTADIENQSDDDTLRKVSGDLAQTGILPEQVAEKNDGVNAGCVGTDRNWPLVETG